MRLLVLVCVVACSRTTEFIGTPPAAVWNCGPRCFRDENPPNPPQPLFVGDPDPVAANRPELRYPLADSLHPINLAEITFQWRSATAMLGYYRIRVTARASGRAYDFYVPCRAPPTDPIAPAPDECQFQMPARAWQALARENPDGAMTVTVTSTRTQPDPRLNFVTESEPVPLAFSPAAIEAGLYYFTEGRSGVVRAPLGGAAQPFLLPTTRFACVGCHAVSRDGSITAYVYDRQYLGVARADDPTRPAIAPADPPRPDAATVSLSPDGRLLAVSQDGQLSVRDAATGRVVVAPEPGVALLFPEWSPDGQQLAVTRSTSMLNNYTVNDGSIVVFRWLGNDLGPPVALVVEDAVQFHYAPSWSPDGAWIAFTSAPRGGNSYGNPQARLRLVPSAGGAPIDLARARGDAAASWPRFAPVSHAGGKVMYLVFDSKRDYGYLLRNSADPRGGRAQLWLAAIDLRRLPGDPSSAPLWLPSPLQDLHVANVLGTWVKDIVCGPQSPCGDRARCESGHCVPLPP